MRRQSLIKTNLKTNHTNEKRSLYKNLSKLVYIADQCGEPLMCITSKYFIQLQVPALVMIKMF